MHVPDRFAATFYVLKVRGCAYGAIEIGNEKKLRLQPLYVDRVRLWWHGTIEHELLTATRTVEVVYRTLCKSWMHGELWHDITKKFTAVFHATHTNTSPLRRPVLSNKVHFIAPKTPRHL